MKRKTYLFIGVLGTFILANFMAVVTSILTTRLFIPSSLIPSYLGYLQGDDFWLNFFNWYAFPIIALLSWLYIRPIMKAIDDPSSGDVIARKRLLSAPILLSVLGVLGWLLSVGAIQFRLMVLETSFPEEIRWWFIRFSSLWMVNVFIISYYVFDYLNRSFYIPWLFNDGVLSPYRGSLRLSIRIRHFILWFTLVVFPGILFILYLGNHSSQELSVFSPEFILFAALGVFTLGLIFLVSRSYEASLQEMAVSVGRISEGHLGERVPIRSSDELGVLAEGMNTMSVRLARSEILKETFGKVVDPRIRDYLLNNALGLGGRTVEAAVLFCDIRGFTSFSESRPPEEVVEFLNSFFNHITPEIQKAGGFVNKYLGDALMAVFGTPIPLPKPREAALAAVEGIRTALSHFNSHRPELPTVQIAMGLQFGLVTAGNIGSEERMEFTVIGDTVNTASRLESIAKEMSIDVVFTREVILGTSFEPRILDLGSVGIRGRKEKVLIASLKP